MKGNVGFFKKIPQEYYLIVLVVLAVFIYFLRYPPSNHPVLINNNEFQDQQDYRIPSWVNRSKNFELNDTDVNDLVENIKRI